MHNMLLIVTKLESCYLFAIYSPILLNLRSVCCFLKMFSVKSRALERDESLLRCFIPNELCHYMCAVNVVSCKRDAHYFYKLMMCVCVWSRDWHWCVCAKNSNVPDVQYFEMIPERYKGTITNAPPFHSHFNPFSLPLLVLIFPGHTQFSQPMNILKSSNDERR